ncbi:MAG: ATP-dependent metallopeptidase FtsH/Yme1/Tma family protein [wastewater metagenome]|nr:ATP-dependent metallopeptidase FtsH/Yme1/Tma family protein [Candidatus Loosdrechtia aerotolerans]
MLGVIGLSIIFLCSPFSRVQFLSASDGLNRLTSSSQQKTLYTISYSQFIEQLSRRNIASVSIDDLHVKGTFRKEITLSPSDGETSVTVKDFQTYLPTFQGEGLLEKLQRRDVAITVEPHNEKFNPWKLLGSLLPIGIIIGIWILMIFALRGSRQMGGSSRGVFGFGQSKAKLYDVRKPHVTFRDVAGMENAKQDLREEVDFLKNPSLFRKMGAKIPKGILLVGPPGTGKTLLARATAGEAGVPFFSVNASEFVEMFVGVGAARVRDTFKKAKDAHPSIIFIDEIDAVGRVRGAGLGGGHDEREQTLNQLLAEMDGFEPHEEIIVMAATNRPDVLDPALLRPGRFDRNIVMDRPGWKDRKMILEIHTRNKRLGKDIDLEKIAKGTPGMTGADLENIANEAAIAALRKGKDEIGQDDLEEARDKILMGAVKDETISDLEKRITAYHESGHTLVARMLPGTDPIHKVSIVPRGMAMGITQSLPEEDRHFYPKSYLINKLSVALAGRVAEKLNFHDISTGAQSDLKEATALAEKMVTQWGMSDKIGPVNVERGEEHPFLGRELAQPKRFSEDMAWLIDQEIQKLITDAERRAEQILKHNRETLNRLAETLIQEESLNRQEVDQIIQECSVKEKCELKE